MSTASLIPGRRREQLAIAWGAAGAILLLMLIVACVIVTWQNDAPAVRVGTVDQFPPGTARMINFDATLPDKTRVLIARSSHFANVTSPLPLYIAHTRNDEWYAIYPRDPKSGCSIAWFDSNSYFIDPCYGSTYTITGAYVRGPSLRNLNGFRVDVRRDGSIVIEPSTFYVGGPAR